MSIGVPGYLHPNLPYLAQSGIQTPAVQILPPSARIAGYVRSGGPADADDEELKRRLYTTLAGALAQVRAGKGDTILVLPGHSENVTDATMLENLAAGTRIVGVGNPYQSDAPTFDWTNTAGQWTVDQNNVHIENLRLTVSGAAGVVKGINVTGSGCTLQGNVIETADSTNKATIAIEVGSGATFCSIVGNYIYGSATDDSTDVIKVVGGTVPSNLRIIGNTVMCAATEINGLIHITVAALNCLIANNLLYNTETASTACIVIDNVAADGLIFNNMMGTKNNGVATAQGIIDGAASLMVNFENKSCDEAARSGVLQPAAVAT